MIPGERSVNRRASERFFVLTEYRPLECAPLTVAAPKGIRLLDARGSVLEIKHNLGASDARKTLAHFAPWLLSLRGFAVAPSTVAAPFGFGWARL